MKVEELISLGALLHDIGKPVQRARLYEGDHSIQGWRFLNDLAEDMKGAKDKIRLLKVLSLFSRFHHRSHLGDSSALEKEISKIRGILEDLGLSEEDLKVALYLVYIADNISSKEREEGGRYDITRPLRSVFNRDLSYPVTKFEIKEPLRLPIPEEIEKVSPEHYKEIVEDLRRELKDIPLKVDALLPTLEMFFTFVSSATTKGNVVSLYDHLRTTAAIALALYNSGCRPRTLREAEECSKKENILLIEGDFSGIQDFIYGVSGKGTLKYLRARSAYLELLSWDIVLEILERLNLSLANLIFNAGGHFLIISQNTPSATNKLEILRKEVAKWLWEKFEGKLYLAIEWLPVSGEQLMKNFGEVREKLGEKLAIRKVRRFEEIPSIFSIPRGEKLVECQVCGREIPENDVKKLILEEEEIRVCDICYNLWQIGEDLPKIEGFVLTKRISWEEGKIGEGPFRVFVPHKGTYALEKGDYFMVKNTLKYRRETGDATFIPYIVADYAKEVKDGAMTRVITFDELSNASIGIKRIGVIKGDVDDMGAFFSCRESLSEYATASRFLDYFFKVYLNHLILGKFGDVIGYVPSLSDWPENPNIVVVYAGGDDFFIVGAWNEIFELAFRIRNAFKSYTGGCLGISMALGYFHPKMPIYRVAEVMKERLSKAKEESLEKNSVFVIDRTSPGGEGFRISYPWDLYIKLWKEYAEKIYSGNGNLIKPLREKKSILYRILEFRELYVQNPEDVRWAYLLAYHLSRHEIEKNRTLADIFPELVGIDAEAVVKDKPQPVYWIDGILKIILMAVRG
ncbi:type III-A CRISPR-associated protein Cas10/Csm1 [Pyrococcus sp. ST04]|uniref:type III-A CRISPR-associated protein Cas10/Csm1 n=1 Tax=Pyrococcus sp. ST04 TaxID=1183377 RepID=UPI000260591F|nr:type III-A CRISPR-associated protein Cas10/Csm1 [Pyrococcus sp. ST04]AFK21712.1 putative CRISPR-associated protein, Csm1 family [Pyrococcus sp. ST04]